MFSLPARNDAHSRSLVFLSWCYKLLPVPVQSPHLLCVQEMFLSMRQHAIPICCCSWTIFWFCEESGVCFWVITWCLHAVRSHLAVSRSKLQSILSGWIIIIIIMMTIHFDEITGWMFQNAAGVFCTDVSHVLTQRHITFLQHVSEWTMHISLRIVWGGDLSGRVKLVASGKRWEFRVFLFIFSTGLGQALHSYPIFNLTYTHPRITTPCPDHSHHDDDVVD